MNDIDKLIERLHEQAKSWDGLGKTLPPKELETKTANALQEMQARIKELEGCMETPRIEDLERIEELESNRYVKERNAMIVELKQRIAELESEIKLLLHVTKGDKEEIKRLDAALSDIENLDINMSIVQKIIDKARAGK